MKIKIFEKPENTYVRNQFTTCNYAKFQVPSNYLWRFYGSMRVRCDGVTFSISVFKHKTSKITPLCISDNTGLD